MTPKKKITDQNTDIVITNTLKKEKYNGRKENCNSENRK